MSNLYPELAAMFGLVTNDPHATIEITSDLAKHDGMAGDDQGAGIASIPANFNSFDLEALGFEVLDQQPESHDERTRSFVRVKLPEGWVIRMGSASGLRDIVDERGVKRVTTSDNGQWWDRYVSTSIVHQRYEVPRRLCYGDGDLESVMWDSLTADEQEEAKEGLQAYVNQGEEDSVYADTAAKAQEWLDRIESGN